MGLATPKPDPTILLHPNIPKPLHQLAPRTIYGDTWWQGIRQVVKTQQNYVCAACGCHPGIDKESPYLSCHEIYEIDYDAHRAYYVRAVALCSLCHLFIHSGFLQVMLDSGKITESRHQMIMDRGTKALREAGLIAQWIVKQSNNRDGGLSRLDDWSTWRLVVDGVEHGPSFDSYEAWYEHFNGRKPKKDVWLADSHWDDNGGVLSEDYSYEQVAP